jgi:hypothetical protein
MGNLNINGWIDELGVKFEQAIRSQFEIIGSEVETIEVKVNTKFGYKLEHKRMQYDVTAYKHSEPLKWGFEGEMEYVEDGVSSGFNPEFILPDVEAMNKIVQKSHNEFDAYVSATLAKMTLLGHTKIFYPLRKNPSDKYTFQHYWTVDDSCISEKGHCVTHILLHPIFRVAEEKGIIDGPPF